MRKNTTPGLLDKAAGLARAALLRTGFHFVSLAAALILAKPLLPDALYLYAGLICLVPAGFTPKQLEYLAPAGAATLFFCGALLLTEGSVPVILLWAGSLSLLLRVAILRLRFSWTWSALPLSALCLIHSLNENAFPLVLFLICALCGFAWHFLGTAYRNKKRLDQALLGTVGLLEPELARKTFPGAFDDQFRLLQRQCVSFLQVGPTRKNQYAGLLAPRLAELNRELAEAVQWEDESFKEREGNSLLASLADMNTLLEKALSEERDARLMAGRGKASSAPRADDAFADFRRSAEELLAKKSRLPENLQQRVNDLFLSTRSIIVCMEKDPGDVASGTRFLNRYLPAAHKAVDEYVSLAAQGAAHEKVRDVLAQCVHLLERLAGAFHEEHGNLLRNDAMRFTADLHVLDTLLKMDGR